jgi:ribosome-binding factor A
MSRRIERINSLIRQEISDLLQSELKDPRLDCFMSILRVDTAPDLSTAKVYISFLGSEESKKKAMTGLDSASRFIRNELMKRIRIRTIPDIVFLEDRSIAKGAEILELINKIENEESS